MTPVGVGSCRVRITPNGGRVNEYGADDEFIESEYWREIALNLGLLKGRGGGERWRLDEGL